MINKRDMFKCVLYFFCFVFAVFGGVQAQPAAWPATSYSPYFQNLFAHASAPVQSLPSGPGAQAPAIPVGLNPPAAFTPPLGRR
ncbi:unnamed protein product [Bursaphelenchus xylophilus]|uniref:(pine wood nematode) hypothetical protein n=1 Tax=Bursaphelenchus xylophilus TaxID=6326 RepID=A0A1I7RSY5_BURXY|nr:unnamed protein product [Bursaphelenchus xylophilus]CAG9122733.1 unnamed protein product [Bursaphelenchus xylophilus]